MIWAFFLQNQINFKKIINIGSRGNVVLTEKDISFQKKPEALLPEVFESLLFLNRIDPVVLVFG